MDMKYPTQTPFLNSELPTSEELNSLMKKRIIRSATNKEVHTSAESIWRECVSDYAASLLLEAKLIAHRRKDDIVLSTHVEEALDAVSKARKRSWMRKIAIFIGAALLGAFVQGFVNELYAGHTTLVVVYTVLGFFGMLLAFWGIQEE